MASKKVQTVELVAKSGRETVHELKADVVAGESIRIYGRVCVGVEGTDDFEMVAWPRASYAGTTAAAALAGLSDADRRTLAGLTLEVAQTENPAAEAVLGDFVMERMGADRFDYAEFREAFYLSSVAAPVWEDVDRTFAVGQEVVRDVRHGSHKGHGTGTITGITAKTVTVDGQCDYLRDVTRLDLYAFAHANCYHGIDTFREASRERIMSE